MYVSTRVAAVAVRAISTLRGGVGVTTRGGGLLPPCPAPLPWPRAEPLPRPCTFTEPWALPRAVTLTDEPPLRSRSWSVVEAAPVALLVALALAVEPEEVEVRALA